MKNTRTLTAGLALAAGLAFAGLSPAQADPVSVVSIHTPETRSERSPAQTARFARQHGLEFPIAIDEKIWNTY